MGWALLVAGLLLATAAWVMLRGTLSFPSRLRGGRVVQPYTLEESLDILNASIEAARDDVWMDGDDTWWGDGTLYHDTKED